MNINKKKKSRMNVQNQKNMIKTDIFLEAIVDDLLIAAKIVMKNHIKLNRTMKMNKKILIIRIIIKVKSIMIYMNMKEVLIF